MQSTDIPTRFTKVFAANAAGAYIRQVPVPSQIGIQDGAASFTDGFVPDNFLPIAGGGVPPFGQDFNGLLKVVTAWEQWLQAGGPITYNSAFATAINGYPKGATLASAVTPGLQWTSTAENNLTNPDTGGANWTSLSIPVKANVAETIAGVDDEKFVTPADLRGAGFPFIVTSSLLENNGYRVWSDGFIDCWGNVSIPPNTILTVGLPYPHTAWVNPSGSGTRNSVDGILDSGVTGIIGSPPTGFRVVNPAGGPTIRFWWNSRGR